MVLGRNRLPKPERHERIWGFVDKLAKSGGEIEGDFREQHYATKTRGERRLPAVRPAGEGVYKLIQRGRDLHLSYELELPERPGEVQHELNIPDRLDIFWFIRNPETPPPPGAGLSETAEAHY